MSSEQAERAAIQAAADRLLAGTPLRSTGELTVVQLAAEAGVKRWLLTHKHRDLAEEFQARAKARGGDPPQVQRLKARLHGLEERHAAVKAENAELRALIEHYATVINELSFDHEKLKGAYEKLLVERNSLLANVRNISDRPQQARSRS
jgi:chromosome segregation ATPase